MVKFNPKLPYNQLPELPPEEILENPIILNAALTAGRALAELKGRSSKIPNPTILLNTIALQEAKASSEIENIFTTNDELYRGAAIESSRLSPHTKEVLHYNRALWQGAKLLQSRPVFSTNLFIEIVKTITTNEIGIRTQKGTFIGNPSTREVIYTPPEGESLIRDKLHNLELFCNRSNDGIDPLIKMPLMHYQFEAIHPFVDGNGRTGRILIILFLVMNGLLELPILYISRYIIQHKNQYYKLLRSVTEQQEWQSWIIYMLNAVEKTAQDTHKKIQSIYNLLDQTLTEAREKLPRRTFSKELIEIIFQRPYCKIRFLEEAGFGTRHTCSRYLQDLEKEGFLKSHKAGKEVIYINHKLMDVLISEQI